MVVVIGWHLTDCSADDWVVGDFWICLKLGYLGHWWWVGLGCQFFQRVVELCYRIYITPLLTLSLESGRIIGGPIKFELHCWTRNFGSYSREYGKKLLVIYENIDWYRVVPFLKNMKKVPTEWAKLIIRSDTNSFWGFRGFVCRYTALIWQEFC